MKFKNKNLNHFRLKFLILILHYKIMLFLNIFNINIKIIYNIIVIILKLSKNNFNQSINLIDKELQSWKGDTEQTDDILVIGIKFS